MKWPANRGLHAFVPLFTIQMYDFCLLSFPQERLLDCKSEDGWNQLFDLIQSELYARPDDVYVNIRLVKLYMSNKRLGDAVAHCQEAQKKISLQSSLEWCSCVVQTFKVCSVIFLYLVKSFPF